MIDEDATAFVHFVDGRFPVGRKQAATDMTNEVVDRHTLPWQRVVRFQDPSLVLDRTVSLTIGRRQSSLLGELACGAL